MSTEVTTWTQLAQRIAHIRWARGLTQADLAARTGIPHGVIARIESCQHNPTALQAQAIAHALEVTLTDLLTLPHPRADG